MDRAIDTILSWACCCAKKNIIPQGAPGVGKTFVAKRAYSTMGVKDVSCASSSFSSTRHFYEDFIEDIVLGCGVRFGQGCVLFLCKKAA